MVSTPVILAPVILVQIQLCVKVVYSKYKKPLQPMNAGDALVRIQPPQWKNHFTKVAEARLFAEVK